MSFSQISGLSWSDLVKNAVTLLGDRRTRGNPAGRGRTKEATDILLNKLTSQGVTNLNDKLAESHAGKLKKNDRFRLMAYANFLFRQLWRQLASEYPEKCLPFVQRSCLRVASRILRKRQRNII